MADAPGLLPDPVEGERDGVRTVRLDDAGPLRARLVLRVGAGDEPVPLRGVSHLVEHLVMRQVGRRPLDTNAHVGPWTTTFEATGDPAEVGRFLGDVWAALGDLDTRGLDLERRVLGHEGGVGASGPAVDAVVHRFGWTGPGVAAVDELVLEGCDAGTVLGWVRDRYVRDAAVLVATGEVPVELTGGPVAGERALLPPARAAREQPGPVWVGDVGGTAVSLLLPGRHGLDLALGRLLSAAAETAVRHERGLAYEVGMDVLTVDAERTEVAVHADNEPEDAADVARLLVDVVRRMSVDGPSGAELAHERATTEGVWRWTPDALEIASEWAFARLVGDRPRGVRERLSDAAALDRELVRQTLAQAWPSLQMLLPDEEDPGVDGVAECLHRDEPVAGRRWRGSPLGGLLPGRTGMPASVSVVGGDEGLTWCTPEETTTVRWDDVVAVVRRPDGLVVMGRQAVEVPLPDGGYLGWRRLRALVEERVPTELFVVTP